MKDSRIPNAAILVVGEVLGMYYYSHRRLDVLFAENGAPGDPPPGNCIDKCQSWFRRCNETPNLNPLEVLGSVLSEFMDSEEPSYSSRREDIEADKERIRKVLGKYGLQYEIGGRILGGATGIATRQLAEILESRDFPAIEREYDRALRTIETDPPAALTAACAILEALCKHLILSNDLEMPSKETVGPMWKVVSASLGLSPSSVESEDLKRILSGLVSIVDGVGALRTHAGSAHGHAGSNYKIEPRHARLALHASHTVVSFVFAVWEFKSRRKPE